MSPTDPTTPDPGYWRSLAELAESEEFRQYLAAEFPEPGDSADPGVSRRRFLQLMSASVALAGLAGCRWPAEKIVPFASRPEGYRPGEAKQFASTFELAGVAYGILVTSMDGRPIKVEGNPQHPFSLGATDLFAQASVLELYDPDRSQGPVRRSGKQAVETTWEDFVTFAQNHFAQPGQGRGFALLSETSTSPSLQQLKDRLLTAWPAARWYEYEPVGRDDAGRGAAEVFGQPYRTHLDLSDARVIVDLEANLLQDHPTALRNTRQFTQGRQPDAPDLNRLYVFESGLSVTGAMADHRFPIPSHLVGVVLRCLAAELFLAQGLRMPAEAETLGWRSSLHRYLSHSARPESLTAIARDLLAHQGQSLIVIGPRHADSALAHLLNVALGNVGSTVSHTPSPAAAGEPGGADEPAGNLDELTAAMRSGQIATLLILGGNPVFNAPADLEFAQALTQVNTSIHLSLYRDETSAVCHWHLPRAHSLESWGDARAYDGTLCAVQPLISPLYGGKTPTELLSLLVEAPGRTGHDITRHTFHRLQGGQGDTPIASAAFEKQWHNFLHDGFLPGSHTPVTRPRLQPLTGGMREDETPPLGPDNLELVLTADSKIFDGRFANNAWLQELPDALTKLTWDNSAILGPATAAELGVRHGDLVTQLAEPPTGATHLRPARTGPLLGDREPGLRPHPSGSDRRRRGQRRLSPPHQPGTLGRTRFEADQDRPHLRARLYPGSSCHRHAGCCRAPATHRPPDPRDQSGHLPPLPGLRPAPGHPSSAAGIPLEREAVRLRSQVGHDRRPERLHRL